MDLKERNIAEMIAKVIEEGKTTNIVLACKVVREFHCHFFKLLLCLRKTQLQQCHFSMLILFILFSFFLKQKQMFISTLTICSASDTDDSRELLMAGRSRLSIQEFASAIPNHLLLGSLLEHLCFVYESNPARSRMLFKGTQKKKSYQQ